MHKLALVFALALTGAAPAEVPVGAFQTWSSYKSAPLDFSSGGISVHVAALPCPAQPVGDSTCRWEGYNNQAAVTVRATNLAPLTITTDSQSAYARIAIVRFDAWNARAGVIVESQSGGSGGDLTVQLLVPQQHGYRILSMGDHRTLRLQGEIADFPRDLSGDGRIDLQLGDAAFDSAFGCNACTPRPPKFFAIKHGTLVDESDDPRLRGVFEADMARLAPKCLGDLPGRNGACAAYLADAARAGAFPSAWAAMLSRYEHGTDVWRRCAARPDAPQDEAAVKQARCYRDFPESVHAFLVHTGYISPIDDAGA